MKTNLLIACGMICAAMPAPLPLPIYAAQASADQCMDRDTRLAEIVRTSQPPQSASTIVHLTNVMYVVGEALATLDRDCRFEPDYPEFRASYQASYDSAKTACLQLASSSSYCVPTRYVRGY